MGHGNAGAVSIGIYLNFSVPILGTILKQVGEVEALLRSVKESPSTFALGG